MMRREELYFDSRDNVSKIYASMWIPDIEKPRCIVQIIHGMAEYIGRYDDFAGTLVQKGILVVGEDHLGHGKTVPEGGNYGYFCERDAATVIVRDAHRLKKMMQEKYPGIPYVILGHSMGSFILRSYLQRYGTGIQAAVLVGTGMPAHVSIIFGKILAGIQKLIFGPKHPGKLLNAVTFGGYNKRVTHRITQMDWISSDEKVVDDYIADSLCGFTFTVNGFQTMYDLIGGLYKRGNLNQMPKQLPVLFLSGSEDPVGGYGKGVKAACRSFIDAGMEHVQMKLYEDGRHEILNETNKKQVYEDIYQWIISAI